MSIIIELLKGGVATVEDYLLAHLPFVVPAFFLAGALYALFPKEKIQRHIGQESGIKGIVLVILLATLQAGPLYEAFPIAYMLIEKELVSGIFLSTWVLFLL